MENKAENSDVCEIVKKNRSLDLQSLYKHRVLELGDKSDNKKKFVNRKRSLQAVDNVGGKKKKSDRKNACINSCKHVREKSRRSLDEVYSGGESNSDSVALDIEKICLGLGLKSENDNNRSSGMSRKLDRASLSLHGNVIQIPKRRRGCSRRKKVEGVVGIKTEEALNPKDKHVDWVSKLNGDSGSWSGTGEKCGSSQVSKPVEVLSSKAGSIHQANQVNHFRTQTSSDAHGESSVGIAPSEVKEEKPFDDFKENKASGLKVSHRDFHRIEDNGHLVAYNSDNHLKRVQLSHRKRRRSVKENKPLVCSALLDEDEENLEQNAARMLSSRFDPSCTGFSTSAMASSSVAAKKLSFLMSARQKTVDCRRSSLGGSPSSSSDAAGRVLRPRNRYKHKSFARKRRHFYDIFPRYLDAYWVLDRRIKIFWPLDQSWYFGLIDDYDPDRKLHHIKYDDRDEEWINLQDERFKLLLFPSEIPGKSRRNRLIVADRHGRDGTDDLAREDDRMVGSYMDSEPIISWLARSTHGVKSSFGVIKKQKLSSRAANFMQSLPPKEAVNSLECSDTDSLDTKNNSLSALAQGLNDAGSKGKTAYSGTNFSINKKLPIVYVRRRFRQRSHGSSRISSSSHDCKSALDSLSTVASPVLPQFLQRSNITLGRTNKDESFWRLDNFGLLRLTIPLVETESMRLMFNMSVSDLLAINCLPEVENLQLSRSFLLLQFGTLTSIWPEVHLEMLFLDNFVGLRLFLFEGCCLKQAIAFIFLVLAVFHQATEQGKYFDLRFPVTSIRFRLSLVQDCRKQIVFALYTFSRVKSSKWLYLDIELKKHCLLTEQLPLPNCTYDNIKVLQKGRNQMIVNSLTGEPSSSEVLRKRSRQGIIPVRNTKESIFLDVRPCFSDKQMHSGLPPFSLSFTSAPTFFLSLHLKLFMEHSIGCINFLEHDLVSSPKCAENSSSLVIGDCTRVQSCYNKGTDVRPAHDMIAYPTGIASSSRSTSASPLVVTGADAMRAGDWTESAEKCWNGIRNALGTSPRDLGHCRTDPDFHLHNYQCQHVVKQNLSSSSLVLTDHYSPDINGSGCCPAMDGISAEITSSNQIGNSVGGETPNSQRSSDLSWSMNDGIIRSINPTAPRSMWHRNRNSLHPSFGNPSHVWPDGKLEFYRNGFGSGPKKPRTQVLYAAPFEAFDFSKRHRNHQQKGLSQKFFCRANEKRTSNGFKSLRRDLESLSCEANVLITDGDRGWRESGALVVLELVDHGEWRLAVKFSGIIKFSYKAHQFVQPGSVNRFTHAMMWRGGKDWILEFPDRRQWTLFREIHEECYNRNIRAASVKNIPIPGVRLIEENDDNEIEVPFVRSSPVYFLQVESDVDMALNPSRILYDMDSDDETWISKNQEIFDECGRLEISEEMFEKTMNLFENAAYSQQCDHFTSEEIDKLRDGVGPLNVIRSIYEQWRKKRQKKGMPLIRQLQPPLWERYQQQVKEWEEEVAKTNGVFSNGCGDKAAPIDKPAMFAFCLKPRGLEVPNKGSKQRSHRRFTVGGKMNAISGDLDAYHAHGRRSNGYILGDDKAMYPGHGHDSLDMSLPPPATPLFSPAEACPTGYFSTSSDGLEHHNHHPKLHQMKLKKIGNFLSPHIRRAGPSHNRQTLGRNNEARRRKNYPPPEMSFEQMDASDFREFRLRDASGAARHALNMARLKRERAQRLLSRADAVIHRAAAALMVAEAMRASLQVLDGDGLGEKTDGF